MTVVGKNDRQSESISHVDRFNRSRTDVNLDAKQCLEQLYNILHSASDLDVCHITSKLVSDAGTIVRKSDQILKNIGHLDSKMKKRCSDCLMQIDKISETSQYQTCHTDTTLKGHLEQVSKIHSQVMQKSHSNMR